jgi:hypothetical protein
MRAGLWENTVNAGGQSVTRNACIMSEQEQRSKGTVDSMRESIEKTLAKNGVCKLKEFTVVGATRTDVMVCGKSTYKNVTTFRGDSFETVATATTAEGVKTSLMKGRRMVSVRPGVSSEDGHDWRAYEMNAQTLAGVAPDAMPAKLLYCDGRTIFVTGVRASPNIRY